MNNESPSIRDAMFAHTEEKSLFEQAKGYAYAYMGAVNNRPVFPDNTAIEKLAAFDVPLPDQPRPAADVLKQLDEIGSPATVAQTGGRYFGFVNGNAVPVALAARWLSDVWDQNPALHVISPTVAKRAVACSRSSSRSSTTRR